jgi:hypothetical protein
MEEKRTMDSRGRYLKLLQVLEDDIAVIMYGGISDRYIIEDSVQVAVLCEFRDLAIADLQKAGYEVRFDGRRVGIRWS